MDKNMITVIASDTSWIEGEALQQLQSAASLPGMRRAVGLPDLHPGKGIPVGAAFLSKGMIYPHLVGNDIGCGMGLWQTNIDAAKFKLDKSVKRLRGFEEPWAGDTAAALASHDLPQDLWHTALGTIGGGNHFAEFQKVETVPIPDIGAVLIRGYGASLSLNIAARLADENIPVVLCRPDQSPSSILWPLSGHHAQGRIMQAQSALSRPRQKRLWQSLVQGKILAQAHALEVEGHTANDLRMMARNVKSGDPENLEARAARAYWPRLMRPIEDDFKRDTASGGLNSWLNYGYTVLRAGAARAIVSAGLHPSLSLHHESRGEALRLSSDLMEPFRAYVDLKVTRLARRKTDTSDDLNKEQKAEIISVLNLDLHTPYGASPVQTCLNRLCQSFARVCLGETTRLDLPDGPIFSKGGGIA